MLRKSEMKKNAIQCHSCGWLTTGSDVGAQKWDPECISCGELLFVIRGLEKNVDAELESWLEPRYDFDLYAKLWWEEKKYSCDPGMDRSLERDENRSREWWGKSSGQWQRHRLQSLLKSISKGLDREERRAKIEREKQEGTYVNPKELGFSIFEQLGIGVHNTGPKYRCHQALPGKKIDFSDYDWTLSDGALSRLQVTK